MIGAMKMKFYPPFKDEGEVVAAWGEAQLIRYLDGKTELRGGSREDRLAAQEWISMFWHEAGGAAESVKPKHIGPTTAPACQCNRDS